MAQRCGLDCSSERDPTGPVDRSAPTLHCTLLHFQAFISGGGRSDLYLVMARTGGEG
jgi:hypothetical protein